MTRVSVPCRYLGHTMLIGEEQVLVVCCGRVVDSFPSVKRARAFVRRRRREMRQAVQS